MNTYDLQKLIIEADLPPTAKLVGLVLALHINRMTGKIRLKRETTAELCGVSVETVKRAITALVNVGIFERKLTGRSTILSVPTLVKELGRVDGSPMTHQKGHHRPDRFKLDTTHSTKAEEESKRKEWIMRNK